ncbi:MAG TPA: 4-hydroxy-tetrahydrodipicolinate synthase [Candidatus Sumerlaeota bacterium]|nr:MAG: 4-hydroxy-tetrahydrodipicolinate synthase [candidate division BRC1 bacterium ADurb.Bin183]HOE64337.1 4-hydroxy-tetrahydrodipicolinate synthase [Candidatus Sumerlaeota bacterium]HRR31307.1 4-hydroxy-tetrahydrodipicolinate synthase [Candidatus Sumerlaeia bacterium]HON49634.1 4-hydroxy-tetrahydrodipicolinate synthase [Candidatus Sumerlaeota bacterium]HOR65805.1 4-hydroxy-tetrahydrodipicolinate synthase [Candidatus Sumerlaeota bacterium]
MFSGSICAVVTPFKNGMVDEVKLEKLVEFQIANGTKGIVPCGTTGESATMSHEEHRRVIKIVINAAAGRVPVIAGTGSNSTDEALSLTKFAKDAGAQAALLITPYYIKPTQEGLYRHYRKVADEVELPQILYNVPSRTGVSINPETVERLAQHPNIVAIKDATGSLDYASEIRSRCNITILSGNDSLNLPLLSIGAKGAISVVANVIPRLVSDMIESFLAGDTKKAEEIHKKIFPLTRTLFIETNPIPVKAALEMMGLMGGEIRMPLTPLSDKNVSLLKSEMEKINLL